MRRTLNRDGGPIRAIKAKYPHTVIS